MATLPKDTRVTVRFGVEEQALLQQVRARTGASTSVVIKTALRLYAQTLPQESPLRLFERHGLVGAFAGPTTLSERYKDGAPYTDGSADP